MSRILRATLAAALTLTSVAPASSQTFHFRYKSELAAPETPLPPEEEVEYGVGNDIVAYFVAPVGYAFEKRIPVATHDVVEWRKDSGSIPAGIFLDESTGEISGSPTKAEQVTTLWHGYDRDDNRIARAELHFSVFEPVGVPSVVDFYTHVGAYFYGDIPNPDGVAVHTWVPVPGVVYADGMSMMNSAFQGTPTAAGIHSLAWRGYDYLGREVAFAYGDFTVAEGPIVEELLSDGTIRDAIGDQTADKSAGGTFGVSPIVQRSLGQVTYKLLPEQGQPEGLAFSSSTGRISGVYQEFETSASFRIEARDSYDGTTGVSNVFTLTTLPADVDLSALNDLSGTVDRPFHLQLKAADVSADATWAVLAGNLPDGVRLDPTNGLLHGTPTKTELQRDLVIGVTGTGMNPAESDPFDFQIFAEDIEAETKELHVRKDVPFATDGVIVTKGGGEGYTIASTSPLPQGTSLDEQSGIISAGSGLSNAGTYDRRLAVVTPTRSRSFTQTLRVYNPLEVTYGAVEAERNKISRRLPTVPEPGVIGTARYSISDTDGDPMPEWLRFNTSTGLITASPSDVSTIDTVHGPYVVTLEDDQDVATSPEFNISVKDRPALEATANDRDVERYVYNGYRLAGVKNAVNGATYAITSKPSNWDASGLRLSADGWILGRTEDPVGTVYPGIVITATDGEGYSDSTDPFDLTVLEPEGLGGLFGYLNKNITWTVGQQFTGTLPELRNGYGTLTYTFDPPVPGVTMTDPATGAFTGAIATAGKTTHTFTVKDETDRPAARGTFVLDIREELDTSAQGDITLNRAAHFAAANIPAATGGVDPFTYSFQGKLPEGMRFLNGVLWGTPREEGDFPVSITVTDKTGAVSTASFTIKVGAPLPFELEYPSGALFVGVSGQNGFLKVPTLKNAMPDNQSITWGAPSGALPPGVSFLNGRFTGTPTTAGRFPGVLVTATDGEGRQASANIDFIVSLQGDVAFDAPTFRHRVGSNFTDSLSVSNAVHPLTFTSTDPSGMPHGLILNRSSGTVTGSFSDIGIYTAAVTVEDDMNRKASATVTFEIVGELSVTASDASLKQYEAAVGTPEAVAENSVGTLAYNLVEGTLPSGLSIDPATGAVTGTSDEAGTWSGLIVEATDTDGSTARSNAFTVTVEQRPALKLEAPAALSLKRFSASTFAADAKDAIPPVLYDVTPDLPAGLILNVDTGEITGSSDEIVPETLYTLSAVDSKAGALGTDVASFTLKVDERDKLDISIPNIPAKRYSDLTPVQVNVTAGTAVGAVSYEITPDLPGGITFADGTISGRPAGTLEATTYTISATDEKGGELGTDVANFTLSVADRDALGISGPDSYEFPQYFEGEAAYQAVAAIDGATFSISPALPDGLKLDEATGLISGTAAEKLAPTQFTLTVADAYDSFDKTITLSVGDHRPLEITTPGSQSAILGGDYSLTVEVDDVVGETVTWEHVSGTLPAGIDFDAGTGTFSGTPTEFGVTSTVTIRAIDGFGGLAERTFVFTILQDGTPITLTAVGGKTRAGHPFDIAAPSAENLVGDYWYVATGLEGTGLVINRKTGKLEGRAAYPFERSVTIAVEDVTGRRAESTIALVSAPEMVVTAQTSADLIFNYDPTSAVPTVSGNDGAVNWVHLGVLPAGLSIDPSTGSFVGKPMEIGTFGPVVLTVSDSLPGSASSQPITIKVAMNEDPLELEVADFVTKIGYDIQTAAPTYGNNLGDVTFFSTDLPEGLSLDPLSGVLTGDATELMDRNVNISIRDTETLRVISRPLNLQVLPLMQVTVPSQLTLQALNQMTPVAPTRNYVIGSADWEPVEGLPEGVTFDTASGRLIGEPKELGQFGPFTVASTDSLGDRGVSNTFTINVVPGAYFLGLEDSVLPDGVKRVEEYTFDFKSLLTYVGMAEDEIVWTMTPVGQGMTLPPGLALANGVLSGTPSLSGDYVFEVKASYGTISASRTYSLKVALPAISLALPAGSLTPGETQTPYSVDLKPLLDLTNIEREDVEFAFTASAALGQSYPPGLSLNQDGTITGTPTTSGEYKFVVKASYTDQEEHVEDAREYTLKVTGVIYRFRELAAGNAFTCGVDTTGVTKCFGSAIVPKTNIPTVVAGLGSQSSIAAGDSHACVVSPTGELQCWGSSFTNTAGGVGSPDNPLVPAPVPTILPVTKVSTGSDNVCFIMTDKTVGCFGSGYYRVNGDGTNLARSTPVAVAGLIDVVDLTVSTGHACALTSGGGVKCWGTASYGRTGIGTETGYHGPTDVVGLQSGVRQIAAGSNFTCATLQSGGVKCWGWNGQGNLGDGTTTTRSSPVDVVGLSDAKYVGAGTAFACAVRQNGSVQCWGHDHYAKLGNGSAGDSHVPTDVLGLEIQAVGVTLGQYHACAWAADGTSQCWGLGQHGQLGPRNFTSSGTAILVGT